LEKLESVYVNSKFISANGIFVFGDSYHDYLVALILPEKNYLRSWCEKNKIFDKDSYCFEKACKNQEVIKAVLEDLSEQAKISKLNKIEMLKKVFLVTGKLFLFFFINFY
jgi:long-chain acyl-CoA synthetase